MKTTLIVALIVVWLSTLPVFNACSSPETAQPPEGFAIYLTRNDIPVSQMEALSHVDLADEPLISISDIISYNIETHEIELTPEAYERVMGLQVPTSGKSFMVCVDKQPIYWGAFWTPVSSQYFTGVTIWIPLFSQQENTIKLELGYPSASFFQGDDPRSNCDIMKSLEQAGKLK